MDQRSPRQLVSPDLGSSTTRPPTIREVARIAGVSAMTVSRVLNGRGYVADETASRVRAAFARLQYRPNSAARLLRGSRSQVVGVTIPSLTSSVHRGVVAGVEAALGPADYQLLLGHLQSGSRGYSSFLESVQRQHCDGYVIVPSRADAEITTVPGLDRPAVVALSSTPGLDTDAVLVDGSRAARAATELLLERFGGPVAFVGVESRLSHDLSVLDGYRQALRATGCAERVLLVRPESEGCRDGVRAMLAASDPPRAFLLQSSLVVFEALGALVQAGCAVGGDPSASSGRAVGVVPIASEERPWTALLPVPLPLLFVPAREVGRWAGEMLLRRLRGEAPPEPERLVIPMELLLDHTEGAAG